MILESPFYEHNRQHYKQWIELPEWFRNCDPHQSRDSGWIAIPPGSGHYEFQVLLPSISTAAMWKVGDPPSFPESMEIKSPARLEIQALKQQEPVVVPEDAYSTRGGRISIFLPPMIEALRMLHTFDEEHAYLTATPFLRSLASIKP